MTELVKERHEGTAPDFTGGDEETWNTSVGTGSSRILGTTQVAHGDVPGWGNRFRRLNRQGSGWDARQWINFAAVSTAIYCRVEMIVAGESLGDGDVVTQWRLTGTPGTVVAIRLRQASGALNWRMIALQDGDGGGFTAHDGPTITAGTGDPTRVSVHQVLYDFDGARLLWYQDGEEIAAVTGITPATDVTQVMLGEGSGGTQVGTTVDFDRIMVDDERWPDNNDRHTGLPSQLLVDGHDVTSIMMRPVSISMHGAGNPDLMSCQLMDYENRCAGSENLGDENEWAHVNLELSGLLEVEDEPREGETAWEVQGDGSNDIHRLQQSGIPGVGGKKLTATCWVASDTGGAANYEIIVVQSGTTNTFSAKFDIHNGDVESQAAGGDGEVLSARIIDTGEDYLGETWWKVAVTGRLPGNGGGGVTFIHSILDDTFNRTHPTITGNYILLWRPQLSSSPDIPPEIPTAAGKRYILPNFKSDVTLDVDWKEQDGAPWGSERLFGGTVEERDVMEVSRGGEGPDIRTQAVTLKANGWVTDLGRRRLDAIIPPQTADLSVDDIIALSPVDGYTSDGNETAPSISEMAFDYTPKPAMLDEAAERAGGRVWRVDPEKNVGLWGLGERFSTVFFDRDLGTGAMLDNAEGGRVDQLFNRVRVTGADGLTAEGSDPTSIAAYGQHDSPVISAPGVSDPSDLSQIVQAALDARKDPVRDPRPIQTYAHAGLTPGMAIRWRDTEKGDEELVKYIAKVQMDLEQDGGWRRILDVTTEKSIAAMKLLGREPLEGAEVGEMRNVFVVAGPVPNPDAAAPTPGSDEIIAHIRWDDANDELTFELRSGSNRAGTGWNYSFRIRFFASAALTLTPSTESTEAGENLGVSSVVGGGNGSTNPVAETQDAGGDHATWALATSDTDRAVVGVSDPSLVGRIIIGLRGTFPDTIDRLSFGDYVLGPVEVGGLGGTESRTVQIELVGKPLVETAMIAAGAVGDNEISGVGAGKVTETATLGFVHPSYTDGSRRPDTLRKSSGDLAADDAFDKTADDLDAVPDGATHVRALAAAMRNNRPAILRRSGGGDVDADDCFDLTKEDLDDVPHGTTFRKLAGVDGSNKATQSSMADDSVGNPQIIADAIGAVHVGSSQLEGVAMAEAVVDEFQNMGSTLSDGQWDDLTVL